MCFFFFKQKTAYEMRISDWSSDVCSSDLQLICDLLRLQRTLGALAPPDNVGERRRVVVDILDHLRLDRHGMTESVHARIEAGARIERSGERRVGKECVVRLDLGGRRIIKKKNKSNTLYRFLL